MTGIAHIKPNELPKSSISSMSPSVPPIYRHPTPHSLLPHLTKHLPYSLPLTRRLQFHYHSPYAYVLSTISPDISSNAESRPIAFAAAYVDRFRAPETECLIFTSFELADPSEAPVADRPISDIMPRSLSYQDRDLEKRHLLALLEYIRCLPLPLDHPSGLDRDVVFVGALHVRNMDFLKTVLGIGREEVETAPNNRVQVLHHRTGVTTDGSSTSPEGLIRKHTVPYRTYIFPPPSVGSDDPNTTHGKYSHDPIESMIKKGNDELPPGLEWTKVQPSEYSLVINRTTIPRTEQTVALWPGVGLRVRMNIHATGEGGPKEDAAAKENGRLIAWGFRAPEGSLTTLHVEEGWRGRGLAKLVAARVFGLVRASVVEFGSDDGREGEWCHCNVAADNAGSIGVAKALGGIEAWNCYWCWIDLRKTEAGLREVNA